MTDKEETVTDEDVREMARLYVELESIFSNSKMKVAPTSEDIQKMAVSVFIHKADTKASNVARTYQAEKKAEAKAQGNEYPDRECGKCHKMVSVAFGKESGKPYYACKDCNVFVNDNGTVTERKPYKKK